MMTTNFKKARPFRILKQKLSIVWTNDQTQDSSRENCDKAKPALKLTAFKFQPPSIGLEKK
jgi:hypothetical protein